MSEGYKGRVGREMEWCCWGEGLEGCSALGMAVLAFYGAFGTRH